jgi:mycofactocin precursor
MAEPTTTTQPIDEVALTEETTSVDVAGEQDEEEWDEELDVELIIEDFTIDGICGVY